MLVSEMQNAILEPEDQVLTTLEKDGSRHWMKPKLAKGFFLNSRRVVAYALIAVFTLLPFARINGQPALLLDIVHRHFSVFGLTFYPTDTLLLAIFGVGLLVSIFLLTSLFGRVWCGWACPQTVYMEFVFRPIERLFDGTAGRGGPAKKDNSPAKTVLRYFIYLLICFYLSNTFLAYFVGTDTLIQWVQMSPLANPVPFMIVAVVTFFMMYNFCFFREQLCILACPYGRFQSVLLDRHSMVIAYDKSRGEPRGKLAKKQSQKDSLPVLGDCVDCKKCVTVCPTGIDIRDGLQMECINCTQCIDTCNDVMKKTGRQPGLIRFSSTHEIETGKRRLVRARVILYPIILLVLLGAFVGVLMSKQGFTATLLRGTGNQYSIADENKVRNQARLRLVNRGKKQEKFKIASSTAGVELTNDFGELVVEPGAIKTFDFSILADHSLFKRGKLEVEIEIQQIGSEHKVVEEFDLLGPVNLPNRN